MFSDIFTAKAVLYLNNAIGFSRHLEEYTTKTILLHCYYRTVYTCLAISFPLPCIHRVMVGLISSFMGIYSKSALRVKICRNHCSIKLRN